MMAFYEDVWNQGNEARVPDLFHEGFTFRGSLGPEKRGYAEFCYYVDAVGGALADYVCTVPTVVVEGRPRGLRRQLAGNAASARLRS